MDTYARWRIADALRFYQAVRDERGGQSRLDDIVDGETRNAIASFDLIEIVRSSGREFQLTGELEGIMTAEAVAEITTGREAITQQILERASVITPEFGVELVDVRFKRINYTESVQQGGLPADDHRAQAHRRAEPLRGTGPRRRDPGPEGA